MTFSLPRTFSNLTFFFLASDIFFSIALQWIRFDVRKGKNFECSSKNILLHNKRYHTKTFEGSFKKYLRYLVYNAHAKFEIDRKKIAVSICYRVEPSKWLINHAENEQNLRIWILFKQNFIFALKILIWPKIKLIGPTMSLLAILVGNHLKYSYFCTISAQKHRGFWPRHQLFLTSERVF